MAHRTNTADAASSVRDRVEALLPACRDRTSAFRASSAKQLLLKPRSSEIQPTLSNCRGCSANTSAQSNAAAATSGEPPNQQEAERSVGHVKGDADNVKRDGIYANGMANGCVRVRRNLSKVRDEGVDRIGQRDVELS
jgi:hypothetical protein